MRLRRGAAEPAGGLSTTRIEAFSDGVFAIAITLLVLNIHLPLTATGHALAEARLLDALAAQWLTYLSYALSVVVVGVYWVAHHGLFSYIKRADRALFWLNILFLACVAFIPFPTALLGQYGAYRSAVVIYGASLVVTGVLLDNMRWYATHGRRLVAPDLEERLVRSARCRNLMGPAIYLVAIVAALLPIRIGPIGGAQIALALYVAVPLVYILPGRIDTYWASGHGRGHDTVPTPDGGRATAPERDVIAADAGADSIRE